MSIKSEVVKFSRVEQVKKEIKRLKLSQQQIALEVSVSATVINLWLSGKYTGDNAKVERVMGQWLKGVKERAQAAVQLPDVPGFVKTPTAQRITAALKYAHIAVDIACIYSGAGSGKTKTIEHYAAERTNVWVLNVTPATGCLGAMLRALVNTLDIAKPKGFSDSMESAIADRLIGTHGLLICDEAQFLRPMALETLRRLHDTTGIGLALVGNETVYTRLAGSQRQAEFAQLYSRIGKRVRLNRPTQADVEKLLTAWDIGDTAIKSNLLNIAQRAGGLRGVTKTLRLAIMVAGKGKLTAKHVQAAWRDLGGE